MMISLHLNERDWLMVIHCGEHLTDVKRNVYSIFMVLLEDDFAE